MDMIKNTNGCALFYRASSIPVSYYRTDGTCEVAYPLLPFQYPVIEWQKLQRANGPSIYFSASHAFYGIVWLQGGDCVILGPCYNVPVTDSLVHAFVRENFIPHKYLEQASALLSGIQKISLTLFLDKLTLLHYILTGEIIDPVAHFSIIDTGKLPGMAQNNVKQMMSSKESQDFHNTFAWEQQFYHLIQTGNTEKVTAYLEYSSAMHFMSGTMADTPLRQAKNIFIGTATKVGVLAAIPGGLDVEQTYYLIDSYAQECERATKLADIDRLHYTMAMDFCRRISSVRLPKELSGEIRACISYIREHTNESIRVEDVAYQIHRSVSYSLAKFKKETGVNMGAYIMQCKLEDAEELLTYTDKSLSEISNYLCFSSQSYFQNVFKRKYGVTPMQYRKKHHI